MVRPNIKCPVVDFIMHVESLRQEGNVPKHILQTSMSAMQTVNIFVLVMEKDSKHVYTMFIHGVNIFEVPNSGL